ncbi:PHD and RING finger domain-containing protein 1 isoform X2 [Dasypus novemcinctus]|uniref:PHD and RING finger domain-containing protein 1 isoform X2 n=1 Tax=Dasypus novemcinctus TaxID=9361 RepID=UPI00062A95A6|nr:PHD and RING finger domain-containing protein 1 isoform X2 [Dasypus novemcinctus]
MDGDNLDELTDRGIGRDGHLRPSSASLASDTESSGGGSVDCEDGTEGEDEEGESASEDLEDRSGSEESEEDEDEDEEDVENSADTQKGVLEAVGSLNSDDEAESCPICLNAFRDQAVGTPESCSHYFCLDCIVEWSKNANSCPVDRTLFKCICIRAQFGGKILKKIPVESASPCEDEQEDPTFCEVCGRSDREDRLLLCDGCDAGYHMECLEPPLQAVPVDEWFCPECTAPGAPPAPDPGHVSEDEVSQLLADVVPTTSRLRPSAGRTRAIARTRQSERVRATVNRNRITTARRAQHVPRHLVSSLLDETIEAVATGLSTAVYQRPVAPRGPGKRKRKAGRRKKVLGRRPAPSKLPGKAQGSGTRPKKRQRRSKRRRGRKIKVENGTTARSRIAKTLGLQKPARGASLPSVCKPADPSLGLLRADIGAASLSLFGDPYELDPFNSSEELSANPVSPLSAKRRALSQSALRSHQPVARPVSVGLSRRSAAPAARARVAPAPDLLGSILSSQSLLMLSSSDIVIHRDGSLSAKRAAPVSFQRNSFGSSGDGGPRSGDSPQAGAPPSQRVGDGPMESSPESPALTTRSRPGPAPAPAASAPGCTSGAALRPDTSLVPRSVQAQNPSNVNKLCLKRSAEPRFNGDSKRALPPGSVSSKMCSGSSRSPLRSPGLGQPPKPGPRRVDVSALPRIPKMRRGGGPGHGDSAPASGQRAEIPSACISRLTGRGSPGGPGQGARAEGEPGSRGPREPGRTPAGGSQPAAPSSQSSLASLGPSRGKGMGSTFESFRINIPGNAAHSSRAPSPGFCNTFRPVDSKAPRKDNPAPLFSIKKTKQLKSEIYDPFDPTGSDSSSPCSSPERPGPGLLPSEITRTISIRRPEAPVLQAVRCVTSYVVGDAIAAGPESSRGPFYGAREVLGEEEPSGERGPCIRRQRPSLLEPWEDEDRACRSSFFSSQGRTVTCVAVVGPDAPPSPQAPLLATHRVVELRSPSRSRSRSLSCGKEKDKREPEVEEKTQAGARSRSRSGSRSGSRCRARSSRSASLSPGEDHARKHRAKAKSRRSSSDGSSSRDRARRKKPEDKGRDRRRGARGRRAGSPVGSPGSSSHEHHESRKKRRRGGSRPRGREGSPPSSLDRVHRHGRRRDPRGRRRSPDRGRRRSRSPDLDPRPRERRRPRSREKRPQTRSPERKLPAKVASPPPAQEPRPAADLAARPPTPAQVEVSPDPGGPAADHAPLAVATPAEAAPGDLDYGDTVEAGHVFEDFSSEAFLTQLDDMSSPPSPESTDSSPERGLPACLALPAAGQQDGAIPAAAIIGVETSLTPGDGATLPPPPAQGPPERGCPPQASAAAPQGGSRGPTAEAAPGVEEEGPARERAGATAKPPDAPGHAPLLRSRAPVKRVTWNLQEEGSALPEDQAPRTPLHRLQRPRDGAWEVEGPSPVTLSQALPPELPAPGPLLPAPAFLLPSSSQVYSPNMPLTPAPPSSVPPCAPVSQPVVQLVTQGSLRSLPPVGCVAAPSLAPVPPALTAALEPAGQAPTAPDLEEGTAAARPALERSKSEEYLKKLQVQERAVEEVKLAIKPFYQKREVSKEEYKDILRKAVQKICHSKSGEINPTKVGNLVRAYVDKYKHMRRHRRAELEGGTPAQEPEG